MNILCSRGIDGKTVRSIGFQNGELDEESALALARTWGPDPCEVVRAAPNGILYDQTRR